MANRIDCDYAGCADPDREGARAATWMVQKLDGSLAAGYCDLHWPPMAVTYADEVLQSLGSSLSDMLAPTPPGPDDPTDEPEPMEGAADNHAASIAEGLDNLADALDALTSQDGPGATEGPAEVSTPTHVVAAGTSSSRRAYEKRKRARERAQAEVQSEG